ncbi:CLUMA_CG007238, isoform A [Clunio marinus]|uniref:CLUMA_CG007238, isoform A n=1 Tax=Clunio marinus TaxID=568069 RepID=A0A1J1I4B3_9DIPT|nr:CLUMA_CG007238, isoform A [Clunio marinus]
MSRNVALFSNPGESLRYTSQPCNIRNSVLKVALSDADVLNFIHINPGSLKKNIDEIRLLVQETNIHIIAISETWLKSCHNDFLLNIDRFKIFRNDRKSDRKTRGGGVAIYVRNGINAKIVAKSRANGFTEFLFIEVSGSNHKKLVFGVTYNPPDSARLQPLYNAIEMLSPIYEDIVIIGDFNTNLLTRNSSTNQLLANMSEFGLNCKQTEPTNFSNIYNPSLIDLIFCNSDKILRLSQISPGSFTTHDLLFGSFDFTTVIDEVIVRDFLDFKNVNKDKLQLNAVKENWEKIYDIPNIDDQVAHVTTIINKLISENIPVKKIYINQCNGFDYNNPKLHRLINLRNYYHKISRRESNGNLRNKYDLKYRHYRNKVTLFIRNTKSEFYKKKFSLSHNPKKLWNNLKSNAKRKLLISPPTLTIGNDEISYSDQVKVLGLTITNNLSWDVHVNNICHDAYYTLSCLRQSQYYVPMKIRMHLIKSLKRAPNYLFEKIIFKRLPRGDTLSIPMSNGTNQHQNSFFMYGVRLWNSLEADLRRLDSLSTFKKKCLSHFAT